MRSKSGPDGTLYHYGLCELAQRQAVLLRKDKSPIRAIKSDKAKVVMTAGCISKNFDISNYIYDTREIATRQIGICKINIYCNLNNTCINFNGSFSNTSVSLTKALEKSRLWSNIFENIPSTSNILFSSQPSSKA